MSHIIIEGVYCVNDATEDLFFDIWDEDHADPNKIEALITASNTQFKRIDNPLKPYCPDPLTAPDQELWLWAENDDNKSENMVSTKVKISKDNDNKISKEFTGWTLGQSSVGMVVYKRSCCPEWSIMLFGQFEDGWDIVIKDSVRTHKGAEQHFKNFIMHDEKNTVLAHDYDHVQKGDAECNHGPGLKYTPPQLR